MKITLKQNYNKISLPQYNLYNKFVQLTFNPQKIQIYPDNNIFLAKINKNKIQIAMLLQPQVISHICYAKLLQYKNFFYKVFTHHMKYVDNNKIFWYPFGGTFIHPNEQLLYKENKTKDISMLLSDKKWTPLQRIRHQIAHKFKNHIDLYGNSYINIGSQCYKKIITLKQYKYQVVVQNSAQKGFFSQKLIDCFRTGTIPIYLGSQILDQYEFDKNGILFFNKIEDLNQIFSFCNQKYYNDKYDSVIKNYHVSQKYLSSWDYIGESL